MSLSDVRDISAIAGTVIALVVYIRNSRFQRRSRKIDNIERFLGWQPDV